MTTQPTTYPKAKDQAELAENFKNILERIRLACEKSGREPNSVKLLPVTKTVDESILRMAYDLGFDRFAENKVQEVSRKCESMADLAIDWVVIGHLQSNKVKYVARFASEFQALDSVKIAEKLEQRLAIENRTLDVLIQVNTSGEESKFGLAPEEVADFIEQIKHLKHIKVKGLMTLANIASSASEQTEVRACFVLLRELRDKLQTNLPENMSLDELSMGMSGDFEIAIEEGATIVRVGQALFGSRTN